MYAFSYVNPVKIIFGKNSISKIAREINKTDKILLTYGGGSIKSNGVYDQVQTALTGYQVVEFGGIEANPTYETLMQAVDLARREKVQFLLAVGGGSVVDGTKFIAAAVDYKENDPWKLLESRARFSKALPIGAILTLPATGSEMNGYAVVSRKSTQQKLAFGGPLLYPRFSVLDPETTFTLPLRQLQNGIVDTFIHVMEQYLTYPLHAPLQERQAEAILLTLVEETQAMLAIPANFDARADLMWCATNALNGWIANGVPQDWTTHAIGHEITALYGLDHAQTLALVLPAVWRHLFDQKQEKLAHYGRRVWGLQGSDPAVLAHQAIAKTEEFFQSLGVATRLSGYGLNGNHFATIASRFVESGTGIGEKQNVFKSDIMKILELCL